MDLDDQATSLLVSSHEGPAPRREHTRLVTTLLDMVTRIERFGERISTVILRGEFARDHQVAAFLRESYPSLSVVVADGV